MFGILMFQIIKIRLWFVWLFGLLVFLGFVLVFFMETFALFSYTIIFLGLQLVFQFQ